MPLKEIHRWYRFKNWDILSKLWAKPQNSSNKLSSNYPFSFEFRNTEKLYIQQCLIWKSNVYVEYVTWLKWRMEGYPPWLQEGDVENYLTWLRSRVEEYPNWLWIGYVEESNVWIKKQNYIIDRNRYLSKFLMFYYIHRYYQCKRNG